MNLVSQMAELQTQFFEQSQLQTQLILKMLDHLERSQQTAVRQDLARIDEIGRELNDIKSQLTEPAAFGKTRPKTAENTSPATRPKIDTAQSSSRNGGDEVPTWVNPSPAAPASQQEAACDAVVRQDATVNGQPPSSGQPAGAEKPEPSNKVGAPQSPTTTADAHAFFSQRMASLTQERNNRWRRILSLFTGKSDSGTDD
jgi:hypothetical protein